MSVSSSIVQFESFALPLEIVFKKLSFQQLSKVRETCFFWNQLGNSVQISGLNKRIYKLEEINKSASKVVDWLISTPAGEDLTFADFRKFKDFDDACLDRLTKACPNIRSLLLHDVCISDIGVRSLNRLESLETLCLSHCWGFKCETLTSLSKLKNLNLEGRGFLGGNIRTLILLGHIHSQNINDLRNANFSVTNDCLRHLSTMKSLCTLDLTECYSITDEGLAHIGEMTSLEFLSLVGCSQITDRGLVSLSQLSKLKYLDLSACYRITDMGLSSISKLNQMQVLLLKMCIEITNNGLKFLQSMKKLEVLSLNKCDLLSNEGLYHLKELKSLRKLDATGCSYITLEGRAPFNCEEIQSITQVQQVQSVRMIDRQMEFAEINEIIRTTFF